MSEQENIRAAHAFFNAWNAGDLSQADSYEADGFMAEGPGAAGPMNKEQNRMYLRDGSIAGTDRLTLSGTLRI
jgi:hypothetical protein